MAKLSCEKKTWALKVGQRFNVPCTWDGEGKFTVTSSGAAVLVNADGTVTAAKAGGAVLTMTAPDGQKVLLTVTVTM